MASNYNMGLIGCLVVVLALVKGATADFYVVGDNLGWTIPLNTSFYSEWASSKDFEIGDQVLFNWTGKWTHNVAEVSSLAEYENCTKPGIVFGSGFIANLVTSGSRFFISSVDNNCERGQKVIITVGSPTNTSSIFDILAPGPQPSGASSVTTIGVLLATFSAIVGSVLSYA
ncbi:hypothetical protein UlMin_003038 [Ulmus minor]